MGRLSLISATLVLSLFLLTSISGCSSENTTVANDSGENVPYASREFLYNYTLLYFYYKDADKFLGEPEDYLGKVSDESFEEFSIPWDYYDIYYMYQQMNDDYTYYTDPSRYMAALNSIIYSPSTMDPGFEWVLLDSTGYLVTNVVKKSPADKAGLKKGDKITSIEGVLPINENIFKKLSLGDEGDTIHYTVQRESTTQPIEIILETYYSPTVELSFKDSIPIIKIKKFLSQTTNDSGTYGEYLAYLREVENYKSIIIDLRNNGGGDGDQCTPIAQTFLSKGDSTTGIISTAVDTVNDVQTFDTTFTVNETDGIGKDHYYVFLANGYTASCSEVLLASVLMNKKFPVVGTTTYGKGIGQMNISTPSLSLATITGMEVVDRDMFSYHKYGIDPDFYIFNSQEAVAKAVELAKGMSYVRTAGYGTTNTGHFAKSAVIRDTMPGFYTLPKEMRTDVTKRFGK